MRPRVTTVFSFGLIQLVVGRVEAQYNSIHVTENTLPNTYIVTFRSDISWQPSSSPHTIFYQNLTSWDVKYTAIREYHDLLLKGAVVKIQNMADVTKLAEAAGVQSVSPVHTFHTPKVSASGRVRVSKRAPPRAAPWPHSVTGVSRLHAAGHWGQGIMIGIVDTGIDYTHPALGAGIGPGRKIVGGYDFVGDDYTGEDDSPLQPSRYPLDRCNGHGTFVAGIIGAEPDPRRNIAGVAYGASLNAYRVAGCNGVLREDVMVAGLLQAHRDGNDVITLSAEHHGGWGRSQIALTMDGIAAAGRVIVAAAGNRGEEGFWYCTDPGYHQGIINVGYAAMIDFRAPLLQAMMVSESSALGPTSDIYMTPKISAPGAEILSTWPVRLGSYQFDSGTSVSTPFMAGAVALWIQVRGRSLQNAWDARHAFQNAAIPILQDPQRNSLVDTASHQGAGLVQVDKAIFATATMRPAELMLNDTQHARLSWRIFIRNMGRQPVTYEITHKPAGTALTKQGIRNIRGPPSLLSNSATIALSTQELTVRAGQTRTIRVRIEPPTGLDPTAFSIYSGYIHAAGSDGSALHSVYLGLNAPLKQMKILDAMSMISVNRFPFVLGGDGVAVTRPKIFTLRGDDFPRLLYRLVSGTTRLRLDLIDAGTQVTTNLRRDTDSLDAGNSRNPYCLAIAKRTVWDRLLRAGRCNRHRSTFDQVRIVGTIAERNYISRHIRSGPAEWQQGFSMFRVTQFRDGRYIPDGDYRLLLRALKGFGDARHQRDYEVWTSVQISVIRA